MVCVGAEAEHQVGRMHARTTDGTELRRNERILFFLLAVVIWPFIAVGVVAGWGCFVWMSSPFTGPPGPV